MFIYPAARKALPDGDQIADQEIAEHAEAEEDMKHLECVNATDPKFDALPRLAESCSAQELCELNLILAPGTGLIDRIRDALSGRDVYTSTEETRVLRQVIWRRTSVVTQAAFH